MNSKKVSSQEVVLRKVPPCPHKPKLIRNSGWPKAEYNKVSSMYVWCVGVLVRSNFGLGGRGESANHIFGDVTSLCKHRNQKRASKEFPRPGFFLIPNYSSHPWTPKRGRFSGQRTKDSEAPQGVGSHRGSKRELQAVASSGVDPGYPTGRQHFLQSRRPNKARKRGGEPLQWES